MSNPIKAPGDLSIIEVAILLAAPYDTPLMFSKPDRSFSLLIFRLLNRGLLERNPSTHHTYYVVRRTNLGDSYLRRAQQLLRGHRG